MKKILTPMVRESSTLLLLLAVLMLAGCGESGLSVKGKVTFDGQPVTNGTITFIPATDKNAPKVGGRIDGGEYEIAADKGLRPEKYNVEIFWHKKTGKKIPEEEGSTEFMTEETVQVVPAKYNTKTTLEATLQPGENTKDFTLTSK